MGQSPQLVLNALIKPQHGPRQKPQKPKKKKKRRRYITDMGLNKCKTMLSKGAKSKSLNLY